LVYVEVVALYVLGNAERVVPGSRLRRQKNRQEVKKQRRTYQAVVGNVEVSEVKVRGIPIYVSSTV